MTLTGIPWRMTDTANIQEKETPPTIGTAGSAAFSSAEVV